jgi:hypothetical protein
MFWTCFLILGAGLHVESIRCIASDVYSRYKDIKGTMFCILWAMIVLGCLLSNMLFKQGNVLRTPRVNIDGGYDKEETKLQDIRKQLDQIGFHSIGMRSTYIKS